MAYEMLTGEYPFEAATKPAWHAAVMAGRYTPLSRRLPSAPAEWEEFFGRVLAVDPEQRPRSANEFLSELEKALSG